MKIKSVAEQLKELGFKDGDRINIKGFKDGNPFGIIFRKKDSHIEDNEGFRFSLETLEGEEFEPYPPARTKEEILEWMKSLSKPFEYGEDNWAITYNYIYKAIKSYVSQFMKDIEPLYFTKENASNIISELTKEEVRILFDLEPEKKEEPKDRKEEIREFLDSKKIKDADWDRGDKNYFLWNHADKNLVNGSCKIFEALGVKYFFPNESIDEVTDYLNNLSEEDKELAKEILRGE